MLIPVGPMVNCFATLMGALAGTFGGRLLPERVRVAMPVIFGLISLSLGVPMLLKMENSLPVVLAVILGSVIGILIGLEEKVERLSNHLRSPLEKMLGTSENVASSDVFMEQFIGVLVLFSVSGMGIFGALNEGMTGDSSVLLTKAVLDFFTAVIFSTSLGALVVLTVIPQGIVLFSLFYLAQWVLPLTDTAMIANFTAVGGMSMIATGLRIAGIKDFPVVNMLPALVIVMPLVGWIV